MAWSLDPASVQDPTTNVVCLHTWQDLVNAGFDMLRGPKAGCYVTSLVGTAPGFMPWATEFYDVNGCHDNVTNNTRITVPSGWGGLWFVGCDMAMSSGIFDMFISINGVTNIVAESSNTSGALETACEGSTIYPVVAGDYFQVFTVGGTARSTTTTSRFYAHWRQGI